MRRRIVLHGLDEEVERDLRAALERVDCAWDAHSSDGSGETPAVAGADAVFTADVATLAAAVAADSPVVVVSRLPEERQYLDAMEAGAFDYCGGPFEPSQLRWILEKVKARRK